MLTFNRSALLRIAILILTGIPFSAHSKIAYACGGAGNGNLTLDTGDPDQARSQMTALNQEFGAETESFNASVNSQNGKKNFTFQINVDKDKMIALMDKAAKLGNVTYQYYYDNSANQADLPAQLAALDKDIALLSPALVKAPVISGLALQQRQSLVQQIKQYESAKACLNLTIQETGYNTATGSSKWLCGLTDPRRRAWALLIFVFAVALSLALFFSRRKPAPAEITATDFDAPLPQRPRNRRKPPTP